MSGLSPNITKIALIINDLSTPSRERDGQIQK